MRRIPFFLILLLSLSLSAQEITRFRHWMGGQESGGATVQVREEKGMRIVTRKEWLELSRAGLSIRQESEDRAEKQADGRLLFQWSLKLAQQPLEGRGEWSPKTPQRLSLRPTHGSATTQTVPELALLWPEDVETALKGAAKEKRAITYRSFSFPTQDWTTTELAPIGADPLPGFPDTIHFKGSETLGSTRLPIEVWISPGAGEIKQSGEIAGLALIQQRAELPAPKGPKQQSLFERSLKTIPPHPFLPWLEEVTIAHQGGDAPALPETAEQKKLGDQRWSLRRTAMPNAEEAKQFPVQGKPDATDAGYLAATPLLQFKDPAFNGLLARMNAPKGLSRWELAKRVNRFVFDWIQEKDYSVGFASALEVCKNPRGDCTEHGVLAVALLRKLGVPARGALGWIAADRVLGLHFWVEVKLGDRWVPIDPTFDQAPASTFRILIKTTDLSSLGDVGWDTATVAFDQGHYVPLQEGGRDWSKPVTIQGDQVESAFLRMRWPQGTWSIRDGALQLDGELGPLSFRAVPSPTEGQLKDSKGVAGPKSHRVGRFSHKARILWIEIAPGRWLEIQRLTEAMAYRALDQLILANEKE
jgi:Transglutaminase-like superfamily